MTAYTVTASSLKLRRSISKRDSRGHGPERAIPMCVYTITHRATGRVYVGQSINPVGQRWLNHTYEHGQENSRVKRAIRKYGHSEFDFSVIDIAECQAQLDHKEQFWISRLSSLSPNGFNLCAGGRGGNKFHPDSIAKMKATKRELNRAKFGADHVPHRERRMTPEERAESRAKMAEAKRGKPTWLSTNKLSEEALAKMRAAKTGVAVPKKYKPVVRSDGIEFESVQAAAATLGCDRKLISQALGKRQCKAAGYYFSYKEMPK